MKYIPIFFFAMPLALQAGEVSSPPITPSAPAQPSEWELRAEPYGWLTALDGTVGIFNQTGSAQAGFDDIWEVIDFAAALQIELRNDQWGIIADGFYSKLSQSFTLPGQQSRQGTVEMKQFLSEVCPSYRLIHNPSGFFDAYAGIRYNYLSLDLTAIDDSQSKN